jgi:hypothetical protein
LFVKKVVNLGGAPQKASNPDFRGSFQATRRNNPQRPSRDCKANIVGVELSYLSSRLGAKLEGVKNVDHSDIAYQKEGNGTSKNVRHNGDVLDRQDEPRRPFGIPFHRWNVLQVWFRVKHNEKKRYKSRHDDDTLNRSMAVKPPRKLL